MVCPDDIALARWLQGDLPAGARDDLEAHVDGCDVCAELVAALGRVAAGDRSRVAHVTTELAPGSRQQPPGPPRLAGPGDKIGRFAVLELVGSGGMGVVYAAYDPQLDRKVALKLLRPDHDPDRGGARSRLLREAKALARITHPNVIAVHEVGTIGDDVFVAMEFIDGQTLRDWLAEAPRSWRDIADRFCQAARGLVAAHAAGLVHRDFKPGNVLIDREGRVRVLDFGLARTETGDVAERAADASARAELPAGLTTTITRTGSVVGTPAYMSPEQIHGVRTDARSDQFSFCVALHEALYGERPFAGRTLGELAVAIAAGRIQPGSDSSAPRWLRKVVARGLAADPAHRHPSMEPLVAALAADGGGRRRWLATGAVAIVVAAATSGAWFFSEQQDDPGVLCAAGERRMQEVWSGGARADIARGFAATGRAHAAETARRVSAGLDRYTAAWSGSYRAACEATHARSEQTGIALDLRMRCLIARRDQVQSLVSRLRDGATGDVVDRAAEAVASLPQVDECGDIEGLAAQAPLPSDPVTRTAIAQLGRELAEVRAQVQVGDYAGAADRIAAIAGKTARLDYPPLHAQALFVRGQVESKLDRPGAEATLRAAVHEAARAKDDRLTAQLWIALITHLGNRSDRLGDALALRPAAAAAIARVDSPARLDAELLSRLNTLLEHKGDLVEARKLGEQALALAEQSGDPGHRAEVLNALAITVRRQGDLEAGQRYLTRAVDQIERAVGPDHPDMATMLHNLGDLQRELGDFAAARKSLERSLDIRRRTFAASHPKVVGTLHTLAILLHTERQDDEAERLVRQALSAADAGSADPRELLEMRLTLASILSQRRAGLVEAERILLEVAAAWAKLLGEKHPGMGAIYGDLGVVAREQGDYPEALGYYRRSLAIEEAIGGKNAPDVATTVNNMAVVLKKQGKFAEALAHYQRALAIWEEKLGPDHPDVAMVLSNIGNVQRELGEFGKARQAYERALAINRAALGDDHVDVAYMLEPVAAMMRLAGECKAALPMLERGLAILERDLGRDHHDVTYNLETMALCHLDARQPARAVPLLERSLAIRLQSKDWPDIGDAQLHLGRALWLGARDRARARQLVAEAQSSYERAGAGHAAKARAAAAWLAAHGAR